jgi:hypothetical protein
MKNRENARNVDVELMADFANSYFTEAGQDNGLSPIDDPPFGE